ncbi:MAG: HEPN domain-containing protein [Candidatus Thermoplasmatota archaeon]|nr:HEPN domain-containing protein [Candidatus Thermoplasmatota archaeon]
MKEAEIWLESAKSLIEKENPESTIVATAQAIHAIIRANDALCMKFLNARAKRHDESIHLFMRLIRENKIPQEESRSRDILTIAINEKSKYDYTGQPISKSEGRRMILNAIKFISFAKKYV